MTVSFATVLTSWLPSPGSFLFLRAYALRSKGILTGSSFFFGNGGHSDVYEQRLGREQQAAVVGTTEVGFSSTDDR